MEISTVSVPEAIEKGMRQIAYPLKGILIASVVLPALLFFLGFIKLGLLTLVIGFSAYFLYDLWAIPRWRLWAYECVDDIHQLQRSAELEGLLIRRSYDKAIGCMTYQQKRKLVVLRRRFSEETAFVDDTSVPEETCFFFYGGNQAGTEDIPVLKLNSAGIQVENEFTKWDEVRDERIARVSYNVVDGVKNHGPNLFRFETAAQRHEVPMDVLNISVSRLDYLLYI